MQDTIFDIWNEYLEDDFWGEGGGGGAEFDQIAVLVLDIQKDRLS